MFGKRVGDICFEQDVVPVLARPLFLRVVVQPERCHFFYATQKKQWIEIGSSLR